jgi:hypothetical protein
VSHLIELLVIVLAPVILFTLLRIDATLVFLSLCLGDVLVSFVGNDTSSFVTTFFPHASSLSTDTIEIILLALPAVLTAIAMIKTVKGSRLLLNIIPAICTGSLGVLLIEPLMSAGTRGALEHTTLWQHIVQAQTLIVGVSAIVIVVFLWLQHRQSSSAVHKRRS